MLEVTPLAATRLKDYLQENEIDSTVRVALMPGGCSGPALALALDEKKDDDLSYEEGGLNFVIDQALSEQCGAVKVDFLEDENRAGFTITSENPIGGGGCSSCSAGSCGG